MEFLMSINLNWIILFLIAFYVMHGVLKGFLVSVFHTVGLFVAWIVGFFFSPMLAENIAGSNFYVLLQNVTESSDRLAIPMDANLPVAALSSSEISRIVSTSDLPMPFDSLVLENMNGKVFESQGIHTVSGYMNATIANVVVNIFAFLLVYLMARVVVSLLIDAYNFASPVPMLKHADGIAGGAVAGVRGFLDMFTLFILVPIVLVVLPVNMPEAFDPAQLIYNSPWATFFYESNFLLDFIPGVIG